MTRIHPISAVLLASTALVVASQATAQDKTQKPKAKDGTTQSGTVVVTAPKPAAKIDRDVYDPKTDPDTPNSSAADALNKAPGVNVDPEGNITLRGNSSVQILVDGKPSAMMQGNFRAITLQSLPADAIASIEVMTTPSAQFSGDAGGGIINIVMKKNRGLRPTLGLRVSAGNEGRYNLGASGGIARGRFTFNGSLTVNHDDRRPEFTFDRERYTANGLNRFTGTSTTPQSTDSYGLIGAAGFNPTDKDAFGIQLTFNQTDSASRGLSTYEDRDATGLLTARFESRDDRRSDSRQGSARFSLSHDGDTEGETFKADLRRSGGEQSSISVSDYVYTTVAGTRRTLRTSDNSQETLAISADYNRQLWGGVFTLGFELSANASQTGNTQSDVNLMTGVETRDARHSNSYKVDQDQAEGYATYQRAFGVRWTVLSGLRIETTSLRLNQLTSGVRLTQDYVNIHPSLALQYLLTDKSKLRYNYGHRITRPNANDLNTFVVYWDDRNARSGNPDLKPSETHLNELRYEYSDRARALTFTTTVFHKRNENVFVERSTYIDGNVFLTRRENGGEGSETGIDAMYNRRIGTKWDVNLQTTLKHERRPPRSSAFATLTEADSIASGIRIGYRPSTSDQWQVSLTTMGKQLTGQGYTEPTSRWSTSYSRKISNKLLMTLNLQDHSRSRSIIENAAGRTMTEVRLGGLSFMLGLQVNPFGAGGEKKR